ncbi:DUF4241 domain-containing protein [Thomasclavelia cocleata]|jgi:hypothetical protein|uniref:DUF4241 domain-containing protein n=1 Tax=Thomasclavelia cocleata TaxID=69824 RepID=UPI00241E79A1|nr:DUF4241 domain-containing protein [Thomasclavelia cocleata]
MGLFDKFKKKENTEIDIQKAFEANLKYISNTDVNINDIKRQFVKSNTRFYLTIGKISCPTGNIIVSDPLAYLPSNKFCPILSIQIPSGEYPVEIAICRSDIIGIRMCTVKLKIKETEAVSYSLAKPTNESAAFVAKDGVLSGFPVDAGMISICDEKVAEEYQDFIVNWYKDNPNGNHYDDYFDKFFKESDEKFPQFQRQGGDFIEWENPKTKNKLVMVASGFGDGFYQSYWGYDSNNEICELIVPLVNPDLFGL